jgi:glutamine cyclotransferase
VQTGSARDPSDGALLVTGKHWPRLYAIELIPLRNARPLPPGAMLP